MKYNELTISARTKKRRVGRGIAAGRGKTAGRGTKGQNSRTGGGVRPGFEGGQNPLSQRTPKLPGFRSIHAKAQNIGLSDLETLKAATVDSKVLFDAGLILDQYAKVKLLSNGKITKAVKLEVQAASANAIKAIEKAGGTVTIVDRPKHTGKKKS